MFDISRAEGKHAEQQDRGDEDFLATDAISDPATEERTRQQPDDPGAEYPTHHFRVEGKRLSQPSGCGTG
ncbi:hypothetical protein D3C80_1929020 [compost metagenome]